MPELRIVLVGSIWPNEERMRSLANAADDLVFLPTVEFDFGQHNFETMPVATDVVGEVRRLIAERSSNIAIVLLNSYDGSNEAGAALGTAGLGIPIIRIYKEHFCRDSDPLEEAALRSATGHVFINDESRSYFQRKYALQQPAMIFDADVLSDAIVNDSPERTLRAGDGHPHLVVAGNVTIDNDRHDVRELCRSLHVLGVRTHLFSKFVGCSNDGRRVVDHADTYQAYSDLQDDGILRLHEYVPRAELVATLGKFDAGLMHMPMRGDGRVVEVVDGHPITTDALAEFERMNLPHRYSAYLAAGLPLAVAQSGQEAMLRLARERAVALEWSSAEELASALWDGEQMNRTRAHARRQRRDVSFEATLPHFVSFLRSFLS